MLEDYRSYSATSTSGTTVAVTASTSFTDDLLVAFVGTGGSTANLSTITSTGLSWTARRTMTGPTGGTVQIFTARASACLTNTSITATRATASVAFLAVSLFRNAGGLDATASSSSASSAVALDLTRRRPDSWIWGVGVADATATGGTGPTATAGSVVQQVVQLGRPARTFWLQSQTYGSKSDVGSVGALGTTNTLASWALAAGEVYPRCELFPGRLSTHVEPSHASAGWLEDRYRCPVRLKGANMQGVFRAAWRNGMTEWSAPHFQDLKRAGFNAVRLWLRWEDFEPVRGTFGSSVHPPGSPERSYPNGQTPAATVDEAFDLASSNGLYVLLDPVHTTLQRDPSGVASPVGIPSWARDTATAVGDYLHVDAGDGSPNLKGYLQWVARTYRHRPNLAGLDLVNEPTLNTSDPTPVVGLYDSAITWVRAVDSTSVLMISSRSGNAGWQAATTSTWDALSTANRRNVVLAFHDYYGGRASATYTNGDTGYVLSGAHVGWPWDGFNTSTQGQLCYYAGTPTPVCKDTATDPTFAYTGYYAQLEDHVREHTLAARRWGIPVLMAEYGISDNIGGNTLFIRHMSRLAATRQLSHFWWQYGCDSTNRLMMADDGCVMKPFVTHIR